MPWWQARRRKRDTNKGTQERTKKETNEESIKLVQTSVTQFSTIQSDSELQTAENDITHNTRTI